LRWKLLVITSLAAAIVGAGGSYGLVYAVMYFSPGTRSSPLALLLCAELFPVAASVYAAVFVYRHTARRRKLQVLIVVLLSLVLSQTLIRFVMPLIPFFRSDD
jgi:branched-subunit amino acid ABC-type transport system permease component